MRKVRDWVVGLFVVFLVVGIVNSVYALDCPGKSSCPVGTVETTECWACCETGYVLSSDQQCCMDVAGQVCGLCPAGMYLAADNPINICCKYGYVISNGVCKPKKPVNVRIE